MAIASNTLEGGVLQGVLLCLAVVASVFSCPCRFVWVCFLGSTSIMLTAVFVFHQVIPVACTETWYMKARDVPGTARHAA